MLSKVFTGSSYFFNLIIDNDKINQSVVHLCTKFITSKLMKKIKFEFFKLPCSSNKRYFLSNHYFTSYCKPTFIRDDLISQFTSLKLVRND